MKEPIKLLKAITPGISFVCVNGTHLHYACHGIGGERGSDIYVENENSLDDESIKYIKEDSIELFRLFDTEAEARAYWEGANDVDGCLSYTGTTLDHHLNIYKTQ